MKKYLKDNNRHSKLIKNTEGETKVISKYKKLYYSKVLKNEDSLDIANYVNTIRDFIGELHIIMFSSS